MITGPDVLREYHQYRLSPVKSDIEFLMAMEIAVLRNRVKEYEKKLADATWAIYPDEMGR